MNIEDLWLLFMKTGKIEYYIEYKKRRREIVDKNDKKSRRYYC